MPAFKASLYTSSKSLQDFTKEERGQAGKNCWKRRKIRPHKILSLPAISASITAIPTYNSGLLHMQ